MGNGSLEAYMNIFKFPLIFCVLALLVAACQVPGGGTPKMEANIAQSNQPRIAAPNVPADDLQALVEGNNSFALDLYRSIHSQSGNLIFSPYSISLALAMTYAGARTETESQMANTLHYVLPQVRLHPTFNTLDLKLEDQGQSQSMVFQPLQLNIANGIWAQQDHPFQPAYLDLIAENYGAGVHLADFVNKADAARQEINQWVSDQTKDKIKDLIPQSSLDASTRMVLANAIYFKAFWQNQFDPNSTQDTAFTLLDGLQIQVKMMFNSMDGIPYGGGSGYQAIELPYQGDTAAMDIIVPDQGKFNEIEASLDLQKFDDVLVGLQSSNVVLGLPKFTYSSQFGLADTLKSIGMTDAFDPQQADFSGMDGQRDLYIGNVIHKAFVAVDEKGTEAAAATAVIMRAASAPAGDIIRLTIDRPFIFVIRDVKSRQILFIGRVLNPLQ